MHSKKQEKITEISNPLDALDTTIEEKQLKPNRDNIRRASGEFNQKSFPKEEKRRRKGFNINIYTETYKQFRRLYLKVLIVKECSVTEFFKIAIAFWKQKMVTANKFTAADDNFIKFASRKGARLKNKRSFKEEQIKKTFINTSIETNKDYYSLMYSALVENDMKDLDLYSVNYFFYDFVEFLNQNINELVQKIEENASKSI